MGSTTLWSLCPGTALIPSRSTALKAWISIEEERASEAACVLMGNLYGGRRLERRARQQGQKAFLYPFRTLSTIFLRLWTIASISTRRRDICYGCLFVAISAIDYTHYNKCTCKLLHHVLQRHIHPEYHRFDTSCMRFFHYQSLADCSVLILMLCILGRPLVGAQIHLRAHTYMN
jgi:hypothetical protein